MEERKRERERERWREVEEEPHKLIVRARKKNGLVKGKVDKVEDGIKSRERV